MSKIRMSCHKIAKRISAELRIQKSTWLQSPIIRGPRSRVARANQDFGVAKFVRGQGEVKPGIAGQSMARAASVYWRDSPWLLIVVRVAPDLEADSNLAQVVYTNEPVRTRPVARGKSEPSYLDRTTG